MRRSIATLAICMFIACHTVAYGQQGGRPSAAVAVARDDFGIAHTEAGNDHDLYFMQGYVHAPDRLSKRT